MVGKFAFILGVVYNILEVSFKLTSSHYMENKPNKGQYVEILLRSPRTIFSTKDVALMWGVEAENTVRVRLNSYVKSGKLIRIYRGIYAKDKNYNRFELATRIYTPSYISFETVLTREELIFNTTVIFVATYVTRDIEVADQRISFVRMKDYVLSNTTGIEHKMALRWQPKSALFWIGFISARITILTT